MIAVERIIDQESLNISLNDQRKYRHITLSNKIDCLLISDSETDKSAACCDVHVGSLCDVKVAQGLAHFLEHVSILYNSMLIYTKNLSIIVFIDVIYGYKDIS